MTTEEKVLWSKLKKKQQGYIFRRQYSIGPYIVDFYCPAKRLVIEVDGDFHKNNKEYDLYRTHYLNALDIQVLRFNNSEVQGNINKVVRNIKINLSPSKVEGD